MADQSNDPCADCGECCTHMDRPPFTLMFDGPDATDPVAGQEGWEDYGIYARVPEELRLEIIEDRMVRGHLDGEPCLWFDRDTRKCRHYDLRPTVCREFTPGELACNEFRGRIGLPMLPADEESCL